MSGGEEEADPDGPLINRPSANNPAPPPEMSPDQRELYLRAGMILPPS